MQQVNAQQRSSAVMVEEAVSAVLTNAAVERHPNPHATGFVRSNSCSLSTRDTSFAVPDLFPVGGVAWPDALLALWKTVRYSSLIGVFTALSRAWFTVDNQLVLWDYEGGREFCVYDEIPELISVVGTPLRPTSGVFQPHVAFVLPVATTNTLFLLGLCVVGEQSDYSELKVVNLGYSCSTDAVITKIIGHSGRLFCAGADGNVYEVRYIRENTPITPKIRLVRYGHWFSSTPVVGQLTSLVTGVWETWMGGQHGGLIDLAIDEREGTLITLSEKSTISLWRINPNGGLRFVLSLRHQPHRQLRSQSSSSSSESEWAPLVRLFVIDADAQGCRLMSIALNGDQFRYRYVNTFESVYSAELILQSHTPSYLTSNKEVSVCYASTSALLAAFSDSNDDRASDEVLAATSPPTVMAPHQNVRDVVTSFSGPSSRIVRVDAIERLCSPHVQHVNDLCAQLCFAAPTYLVVHRHGLSVYAQARPVDTLFLILSSADAECRESLLGRFASVYSASEYAAMLFQIAIGALNVAGDGQRGTFGPDASLSSSRDEGVSLSELGQRLRAGDNTETQRRARELLRSLQVPGTQSSAAPTIGGTEAEGQQLVVLMSPFATGLVTFVAHALCRLWDVAVSKITQGSLAPAVAALTKLVQYLDSLSLGAITEQQRSLDLPHEWQLDRAVVFVPRGRSLRTEDLKRLQASMLFHCYELAHKALQALVLLQRAPWVPLPAEDAAVTFAQLVRDAAVAQRIGRYWGQFMLDAQQGVGGSGGDRAAAFAQLQQRCPYFFGGISTQVFQLRGEMEALTRGNALQSYTESQVLQWAAEVGPKAASYWPSGALQSICAQLRSLKRENVAVELLLHAAAQLDPNHTALNIFLAERNGQLGDSGRFSSAHAIHQTKTQVLELTVATLEAAWLTHRSVVDELLGGPRRSGTIWQIEPSDEYAHCFLFDWLCAPRDDKGAAHALRETLVAARSPFLESYLRRNAAVLTEEYAHYLADVQGDYLGAMQQCVVMAQSPLPDVPEADRLAYRLRCMREALASAKRCHSDQQQAVEQQLRLLEAQQRLVRIATDFISSKAPSLDRRVEWEGEVTTERDVAVMHIGFLSASVASASDLIELAGMYATLGGAEVQLDALLCSNVTDPADYAICIGRAFQNQRDTTDDIARRLVDRYFHQTSSFPLSYLVRLLEARSFAHSPTGSAQTVELLVSLGVDARVLFLAYEAVLEGKDDVGVECGEFVQAGVTAGYLAYSFSIVLVFLADLARRGSVQEWLLSNAMSAVRDAIRRVGGAVASLEERTALEKAEEQLTKAHNVLNGGMNAY